MQHKGPSALIHGWLPAIIQISTRSERHLKFSQQQSFFSILTGIGLGVAVTVRPVSQIIRLKQRPQLRHPQPESRTQKFAGIRFPDAQGRRR
jgi:hypothetical protein